MLFIGKPTGRSMMISANTSGRGASAETAVVAASTNTSGRGASTETVINSR